MKTWEWNRFLPVGAVVAAAIASVFAAAWGSIVPLLMLALAPVVFWIGTRPDLILAGIVALSTCHLCVPGFPEKLTIVDFGVLALVISVVGARVLREPSEGVTAARVSVVAFLVVLLVTAIARGFGFRVFGSETWGGASYVYLVLAGVTYLAADRAVLSRGAWYPAVVLMCLLSLLPAVAQVMSGYGMPGLLRMISETRSGASASTSTLGGAGIIRLQACNTSAVYLFILALLFFRRGGIGKLLASVAVVAALVLTGISGHRVTLIYGVFLVVLALVFDVTSELRRKLLSPGYLFLAVAVVVVLVAATPSMPLAFQRAMSWVPFTDVTDEVEADAAGTMAWRFRLWRMALQEMPQYLWLGKGLAFRLDDLIKVSSFNTQDTDLALASHNYHNGFIGLLLDLGVPGLATAGIFLWVIFRKHRLVLASQWHDKSLWRLHHVMFAAFLAHIVVYILLAGGATSISHMFLLAVILDGLVRSDQKWVQEDGTDRTGESTV